MSHADPFEGASESVKQLLRAEGAVHCFNDIAHQYDNLPWWAWRKRRVLAKAGTRAARIVSSLTSACESADALT